MSKTQESVEDAYDRGFLAGSEAGDRTAARFKKERDADMRRFQEERLEIYKVSKDLRAELERHKAMLAVAQLCFEKSMCQCTRTLRCNRCDFLNKLDEMRGEKE